MPQPTAYTLGYSFTQYQASHPSDPLPGPQLDAELFNVSIFAAEVANNLALIQRDDGMLANSIVTPDSLSTAVLNMMGGFNVLGAWVTAHAYLVGDVITNSGATYVCAVAHTSGTFATDLAAGKWVIIASTGASSVSSLTVTGSSAPTNGLYLAAANTVGIAARSGLDVLRLTAPVAAVNYFLMTAGAAASAVSLAAVGSDTDIGIALTPKGAGVVTTTILTASGAITGASYAATGATPPTNGMYLSASNTLALAARSLPIATLTNPASAVNYFGFTGAIAGVDPIFQVQGSDTDIGLDICSKGAGAIKFFTNAGAQQQMEILHVASAVNRVSLSGAAAGSGINLAAVGSDTDINVNVTPKGAGFSVITNARMTQVNGGQLAGLRNGLINGAFDIWQRNTTFTPTATTVTYTADRWFTYRATNANYTVTRATAGSADATYGVKVQRTNATANTNDIHFGQVIEGINCQRFAGKTCRISLYIKAGANYSAASSQLGIYVNTGTVADEGVTSLIGGGWTGNLAILGTNQAITTTLTRYDFSVAIPANAKEIGVRCIFTPAGTAGADDSFTVEKIQFEEGTVATAFEFRDFAFELSRSLRYYEKTFTFSVAPVQNSGDNNGQLEGIAGKAGALAQYVQCRFNVRKRIAPAVTLYNPSAANAQMRDLIAAADCSSTSAAQISEAAFRATSTGNASTAVGNLLAVHWSADAEL